MGPQSYLSYSYKVTLEMYLDAGGDAKSQQLPLWGLHAAETRRADEGDSVFKPREACVHFSCLLTRYTASRDLV